MPHSVIQVSPAGDGTLTAKTAKCPGCGEYGEVTGIPQAGWSTWNWGRGAYIQDCLSSLSADQREQLISGMHGPCFDAMFPEEPDDEEDLGYDPEDSHQLAEPPF